MKRSVTRSAGLTWRINAHLLMSFACGFIAWAIWPQSAEWWGLGLIAIILCVGAIGEFIRAVKLMIARHGRDVALVDYEAQGGRPKSSRMVSTDDLRRAGMLDE